MSNWKTTTIGQQVTLQRGIDITKTQQHPGHIPVISSGGISSYHNAPYSKGPGVILGRKGTVGTVFYVEKDYWPHDTTLWVRDFHGNDPRFVYYFFLSMAWDLKALDVGTANPTLNRNHVHPISVQWPDIDEQRAIARILGSLDDKIELNRRINHTLEAMATAIFKSWFVDFDPVVAKAEERKPYGISAEVAALFPSSFQDSDIGSIPAGWKVEKIGELLKVVGGGTPSTNDRHYWDNGDIAWATPKDLASLVDPILFNTERKITSEGLDRISSGLLPVGTVLLSSRAPIGYNVITKIPIAINQGFIGLICDGDLPNYFVIEWIRENMDVIVARANGTTFLEISKSNFRPILVLLPPKPVLNQFVKNVSRFWDLLSLNVQHTQTVSNLRDMLLPKLLSGEIRVKQAEKVVEEVL